VILREARASIRSGGGRQCANGCAPLSLLKMAECEEDSKGTAFLGRLIKTVSFIFVNLLAGVYTGRTRSTQPDGSTCVGGFEYWLFGLTVVSLPSRSS